MGRRGITLVEILAVVAIIAILAGLFIKFQPQLLARAEGARCMSNMRSLQVALAAYVQDQGHWPQPPEGLDGPSDDNAYEDWWINVLKPYGISPEIWMCPSIKRLVTNRTKDGRPKMHYTPTPFDEKPGTPYKWATQPWLIEIGNMHGFGALICFPDGSIRTMDDVVPRR